MVPKVLRLRALRSGDFDDYSAFYLAARSHSLITYAATIEVEVVKAIQGERFEIGNNRGGINGWVTKRQLFGTLIAVR